MDPTGGRSDRLIRLYPKVNELETPLPRSWNPKDKYTYIGLSNGNLKVHYKGSGSNHKDAASVRGTHQVPAACGVYYFEIKVISKGRDGYMGIGMSCAGVNLNRLPGWERNSYGYHADDGCVYCSSATGQTYGPVFTTGDVVGCGLNLVSRSIFFTKNGINLGTATSDLPASLPLYPAVGLQTPGEVVEANFGQTPFMFDFDGMLAEMLQQIRHSIEDHHPCGGQGPWQSCMHRLVLDYLVHHGYCSTALTFSSNTCQPIKESTASIKNRQRIQACVLRGRVTEALRLVRLAYPGLLEANKELLFKIKCRQFVEMIGGYDDVPDEVPRLSCHSELGSSSAGTSPHQATVLPLSPHNESSSSVFDNGEMVNGCSEMPELGSAMEVDPPPLPSLSPPLLLTPHTQHTPHALNRVEDEARDRQPLAMDFDLNHDHIRKVLAFGKELQCLYASLVTRTPDQLKQLLQDSFGLLAYTDPGSSPVSYLLDPLQREPVCAALNSAILESQQLPAQPPLEFALGQAVQCLKFMSQNGLGAAAFSGVQDIVNS